jgi:hypothetical protein
MSRWIALATAAVLAVSVTGCAGHEPAGGSPAPTEASPSDNACPVGTDQTVTEADNGSTICLALGRMLTVRLGSDNPPAWSTPVVNGDALRPATLVPLPAAPAWYFTAVVSGSAEVTSSRPNCPSAGPGEVGCHSMLAFRLTVNVPR